MNTQPEQQDDNNKDCIRKAKACKRQLTSYRKKMDSNPEFVEKMREQARARYAKKIEREQERKVGTVKPGRKRTILIQV